jgi:hypothetical protein
MVLMCSCITKKLFKIILNLYTCIQHTSTQPNIKRQNYIKVPEIIFYSYSLSIDITEEGSDDSDDGDFEPSLNFTLRFVMLISYVSVVHVTYILEILS